MSVRDQVDEALNGYHGISLEGVSLGPELWPAFLSEAGLTPDEFRQVEYRGVHVSEGVDGLKLILGG